jgi:glutamine amidotransferase
LLEDLLIKPTHSLIDQSLHSTLGAETTNGDGFGLGWYGTGEGPGVYHSVAPAWNDRNLKELARHIVAPVVLAHIRASTGGAIQQTNCHPFRHGRWLWMHNGLIRGFDAVKRAVGFIEETGRAHHVKQPIQMTVATTDGASVWVFRYSSERSSRSLFYSTDVATLRAQYPDNPVLHTLSEQTRLVVSEPVGDLAGAWNEVPESSCVVVQEGQDELRPLTPRPA